MPSPRPAVIGVWTTITLLCVMVVALPLTFGSAGGPSRFDLDLTHAIDTTVGHAPSLYRVLVSPSDSPLVIGLLIIGVIVLIWRKLRHDAIFLAVVPELAVGINETILKPLWHRHLHDYLSYPSGHTFQYAAVGTGFVLIMRSRRMRAVSATVLLLLIPPITIGMVGLGYHYPTDVIAGACASMATVLALHRLARHVSAARSAREHPCSCTSRDRRPAASRWTSE